MLSEPQVTYLYNVKVKLIITICDDYGNNSNDQDDKQLSLLLFSMNPIKTGSIRKVRNLSLHQGQTKSQTEPI